MNSKEEKKDFVSSSKIEEMGKEKVVINPNEEKVLTQSELKEKKTFGVTYFILEVIVLITVFLVFVLKKYPRDWFSVFINIIVLITLFL